MSWACTGFTGRQTDRSAAQGAYVSYPAEEFYAILSIESHRHQAAIVGEDLGTVPREVNRSLKRHRVAGMFVGQYEFRPPPKSVLRPVPVNVVASLNTHDMPPFEAWLAGTGHRGPAKNWDC